MVADTPTGVAKRGNSMTADIGQVAKRGKSLRESACGGGGDDLGVVGVKCDAGQ